MIYLIGIGLKPKQLTLEAIEVLNKADQIYLEGYTSKYSEGMLKELQEIIGKKFKLLGRQEIEENFESALLGAKKNHIALMIFGNALTATTHIQILLDAKQKGIKYKVIPGISITNTIAESGLDEYKFGRTITICYHEKNYEPETFYEQIKENQKLGLHTICLLDIKKDEKPERMMNSKEAIKILEKIENKKNEKKNWEYIALLGMGSEKQKIINGKKQIFENKEVEEIFPQTLLIPGKMNEKEKEVLEKLSD
jgi:diphthine synthase